MINLLEAGQYEIKKVGNTVKIFKSFLTALIAMLSYACVTIAHDDCSCEPVISFFDLEEMTPFGQSGADLVKIIGFRQARLEYIYKEGSSAGWFGVLFSSPKTRYTSYKSTTEACAVSCSQDLGFVEIDVMVGLFSQDGVFADIWSVTLRSVEHDRVIIENNTLTASSFKGKFYEEYLNPHSSFMLQGLIAKPNYSDLHIFHFGELCFPPEEDEEEDFCLVTYEADVAIKLQ